MRTLDRVLAFGCALVAVFAIAFAAGRVVGPIGEGGQPTQPPTQSPSQMEQHGER